MENFYPFTYGEAGNERPQNFSQALPNNVKNVNASTAINYPARVAVYDDNISAPRVVIIEPKDVRSYLDEITTTTYKLMSEQGGSIAFMVIREVVENYIHAYFIEPTISIMDKGQTIKFSDQGPGINKKDLAKQPGITSATAEMKQFIRGVGSGLPTVEQYMNVAGGCLTIEDNINRGTIITVSTSPINEAESEEVKSLQQPAYAEAAPMQQTYNQPNYQQYPGYQPIPTSQMQPQVDAYGRPIHNLYPQQGNEYRNQPLPGYAQVPQVDQYGRPVQSNYQAPYGYPQAGYPQQTPYSQPAQGNFPPQNINPQFLQGDYNPSSLSQPTNPATMAHSALPDLDKKEQDILKLFIHHNAIGPTDLHRELAMPNSSGSRYLDKLAQRGLVMKSGQKRVLTDEGHRVLQAIAN